MSKIKDIFGNIFTPIAFLAVNCCLITTVATYHHPGHCGLHFVNAVSIVAGAAILLCWLIWACLVYVRNKQISTLTGKPRNIIDTVSQALFVYWILSYWFPALLFNGIIAATIAICSLTILTVIYLSRHNA